MRILQSSLILVMMMGFLANQSELCYSQIYTENFDDSNAVSRWVANPGIGFELIEGELGPAGPIDTNFDREPFFPPVDGVNDDFSGFAFDYSVHGIPSAPNSTGGSTIGLQLQANQFSNSLGGFSASPDPNGSNPLNIDTESDFSVTFDYWGMLSGPFPFGGGAPNGSTMLGTFGVLTAGTTSQSLLSADGVFFGTVADGGSNADYRVYSAARTFSHQCNNNTPGAACEPSSLDVIDLQATHHANTRDSFEQLYLDAIGDPNLELKTAPQSVIDAVELLFPSGDPENPTMSGQLFPGSAGLQWHEMEIRKVGRLVEWYMNGFKLITLDTTDWFDPDTPANNPDENGTLEYGGGNISFGHSDTNFSSPTTLVGQTLNYTLIDNIEVSLLTPDDPSDADGDGDIDGTDFLELQRTNPSGIPDWADSYPVPASPIATVPEPSTWVLGIFSLIFLVLLGSPRQQLAFQRVGRKIERGSRD